MAAWLDSALPQDCPRNEDLTMARLADADKVGKGGMTLTSPAFEAGGILDPSFTADEEDAVAPPLEWTAPPVGTQELVLLVEDASSSPPTTHWAVWGLAGQRGKLLEGEAPPRVGKNGKGNSEWLLPNMEQGDGVHHYVFQLFALDLPLTLMPGATAQELRSAMEGHVTAVAALTAIYQPIPDEEVEAFDGDEFE